MLERGSGVLNDFSCHSSGSPIWELESDCRMRNYIRDNILQLYWWRLQSSTRLGNAMITFFMPFDPAPCDKKSCSERFQEGLVMDERDSSTPNEDCWHSTYRNFCKWHQAPFPTFRWGLGTRLHVLNSHWNYLNWDLLHLRWGAWSWDIICALWSVYPGENTEEYIIMLTLSSQGTYPSAV